MAIGEAPTYYEVYGLGNGTPQYVNRWHVGNMPEDDDIDFSFYKHNHEGNPLPGAVFELRTGGSGSGPGTIVQTQANTNTATSANVTGFVGTWSLSYGGTYRLFEIIAPNGFRVPMGYWEISVSDTGVITVTTICRAGIGFGLNPHHFTTPPMVYDSVAEAWIVGNHQLIVPFYFFKIDDINPTNPNIMPTDYNRLPGATFNLYRYTPLTPNNPLFTDRVTVAGIAAGYWTLEGTDTSRDDTAPHPLLTWWWRYSQVPNTGPICTGIDTTGLVYFMLHITAPSTRFHLVETTPPPGFARPGAQWEVIAVRGMMCSPIGPQPPAGIVERLFPNAVAFDITTVTYVPPIHSITPPNFVWGLYLWSYPSTRPNRPVLARHLWAWL